MPEWADNQKKQRFAVAIREHAIAADHMP